MSTGSGSLSVLAVEQSFLSQPSSSSSSSLNFIPNHELSVHDYFSDSWLLSRSDFLKMNPQKIGIVEDACLVASGKTKPLARSKMLVDWTEFSVEHLSKWWKWLFILEDSNSATFDKVISFLENYLRKLASSSSSSLLKTQGQSTTPPPPTTTTPLHPTIAMVAFAPYVGKLEDRADKLTSHALAATLGSLYKVGFGRIVVTCHGDHDQVLVEEAFRLLASYAVPSSPVTIITGVTVLLGQTEIACVQINDETWLKTKWVDFNMPRAAVLGMRLSLMGRLPGRAEWLGTLQDPSYWRYVYLTEPDTILYTKPSVLPLLKQGLDDGLAFFPHRLQPLPHESDLPTSLDRHQSDPYAGSFLPNVGSFSNLTLLTKDDHCCDEGNFLLDNSDHGYNYYTFEDCGRWWSCGFVDPNTLQATLSLAEVEDRHRRLLPYTPLLRLEEGMAIVFGSTERGRKCRPSKRPCRGRS
ncbi:unnamed protein product [Cylindrotheca closterium]|uniref:Uncharacterized protein n=1 Tax=Cylindrotheca closterium TaxID=2856 RepID=A0AAD2G8V1_9STRA|nr:unnamed protein product [Cylindrotheca closterium]